MEVSGQTTLIDDEAANRIEDMVEDMTADANN